MDFQTILSSIDTETKRLKGLSQPKLWDEKRCIHRKVDAKEIIKLPTPQYVEELYVQILGRPGDQAGIEHYNHLIDAGTFTKEALLVEIRKTEEGMAYGTHIKGISHGFWREKLAWKKAEMLHNLRILKHIIKMRF